MLGRSTTRHSLRPVLETFEERVLFKKKGTKQPRIPTLHWDFVRPRLGLSTLLKTKKKSRQRTFSSIELIRSQKRWNVWTSAIHWVIERNSITKQKYVHFRVSRLLKIEKKCVTKCTISLLSIPWKNTTGSVLLKDGNHFDGNHF